MEHDDVQSNVTDIVAFQFKTKIKKKNYKRRKQTQAKEETQNQKSQTFFNFIMSRYSAVIKCKNVISLLFVLFGSSQIKFAATNRYMDINEL